MSVLFKMSSKWHSWQELPDNSKGFSNDTVETGNSPMFSAFYSGLAHEVL